MNTGLRINPGALDLTVGAGRQDRSVRRGTRSSGVCVQTASSHQAAGRQDPDAQGEVYEEGGPLQLDL